MVERQKVIVPLVGRAVPIIMDEYVEMEFGTGCLKVTPAHDVNDYMLGEKYNLPTIDIFNDNGTISEAGGMYIGKDRFDVRKEIVIDLDNACLVEKSRTMIIRWDIQNAPKWLLNLNCQCNGSSKWIKSLFQHSML